MDREKVIRELINLPTTVYCGFYQLRITHDLRDETVKLLKEQESWINEIAEYQQSISGSGMHELDDYEKGKWDGLQIAWNIISEGR